MRLFRLFNENKGKDFLLSNGIDADWYHNLKLLGISSISNLLSAIKTAKYFEMTSDDIIFTVATDSADMYGSRLKELEDERGEYSELQAAKDFEKCLCGITTDHSRELTYMDKKTIHNLKYFTWREQQEKEVEDLDTLWYDRTIWQKLFNQPTHWDKLIAQFNRMTGL